MTTTIFILANGKSIRWDEAYSAKIARRKAIPKFKQLLEIEGRPLIDATATMLEEFFEPDRVTMICAPEELTAQLSVCKAKSVWCWNIGETGSVLHSIQRTFPRWSRHRTLLLLGDVLYGPSTMMALSTDTAPILPISFAGRVNPNPITGKNVPELYGVMVSKEGYGAFMDEVNNLIASPPSGTVGLWMLYSALNGRQGKPFKAPSPLLIETIDYTDDVDSRFEYENYWPKMIEAANASYYGR